MTEYLNKTFSVHMGTGQEYRDNFDRIFGKRRATYDATDTFEKRCPKCDATDCGWFDDDNGFCSEKTRIAGRMEAARYAGSV